MSAADPGYAERRLRAENAWWEAAARRAAAVPRAPAKPALGLVLEVGCGIGRNLDHLRGTSVGVEHNRRAVEIARGRGLNAFTAEDLRASPWATPGRFDSLLFSHVLEHMQAAQATELVRGYLDLLADAGRVVAVTPQEPASVPIRRTWSSWTSMRSKECSAAPASGRGPILVSAPRLAGVVFKYNEFVTIARKRVR